MRRLTLFSLAGLLLVIASVAGAAEFGRAPGFSLPDSNLKQYDLQDYRGKFVLIDMMKTDCPHCKVFSQTLERVKAKYGNRIVVLSVVHPPDNQQTVKEYIVSNKLTNPILFDCGQMAISYVRAAKVQITPQSASLSLPQLFIVDGEGMLRKQISYSDATKDIFEGKGLFQELDRLLGAGAPAKR